MAIGDPVGMGRRPDDWVRRFTAPDGPAALEEDLLNREAFEIESSRSGLLKFTGLGSKKYSIPALADRINDVFRAGTGSAALSVEVPYAHLALVAGFSLTRDPDDFSSELEVRLEQRWKPYLDPVIGVRVGLYRDNDRMDDRLDLFVGRGVFVPEKDERPIGKVEICLADGSGDWVEPQFPDGRPAGLYRGQSVLAIADRASVAPAVCNLLNDSKHLHVLQLTASENRRIERMSGGASLTCVRIDKLAAEDPRPDVRGSHDLPDGYDARFTILRDAQDYLNVRVVRDRRISTLRRTPPAAGVPFLEVVGIVAPDRESLGREIGRWWIDVDRDGLLVSGTATNAARSLIFAGRTVETFEWAANRFRVGADPAVMFESRRFGGRERTLVRRAKNRPLGFLRLPEVRQPVGFSRFSSADTEYQLDWLDFAGAAEPLIGGDTVRLAEASSTTVGEVDATHAPSAAEVALMEPGTEFFLGPLCVQVGRRP